MEVADKIKFYIGDVRDLNSQLEKTESLIQNVAQYVLSQKKNLLLTISVINMSQMKHNYRKKHQKQRR